MNRFILRFPILIIVVVFGASCSTGMSKEECQFANWQQVGFEDGSIGRDANYIARHRKSCAKASVTPDFDSYQAGHKKGIERWCNYENGARLGESGRRYTGVCPPHKEPIFLDGYEFGKRIYIAIQAVQDAEEQLELHYESINELEEEKLYHIELIVSDETTKEDKVYSLSRITEIPNEIRTLNESIHYLEDELHRAQQQLERTRKDY